MSSGCGSCRPLDAHNHAGGLAVQHLHDSRPDPGSGRWRRQAAQTAKATRAAATIRIADILADKVSEAALALQRDVDTEAQRVNDAASRAAELVALAVLPGTEQANDMLAASLAATISAAGDARPRRVLPSDPQASRLAWRRLRPGDDTDADDGVRVVLLVARQQLPLKPGVGVVVLDPALKHHEVRLIAPPGVQLVLGVVPEREQERDAVVVLLGTVKDRHDRAPCLAPVGPVLGGSDQVMFTAVRTSPTGDGERVAEPYGGRRRG